jgi:hypothetical protein
MGESFQCFGPQPRSRRPTLSSSGEPQARPGDPVFTGLSRDYWVARIKSEEGHDNGSNSAQRKCVNEDQVRGGP